MKYQNYSYAIYVCHNDWGVLQIVNTKWEGLSYARELADKENETLWVGDYANRFEPIEIKPKP